MLCAQCEAALNIAYFSKHGTMVNQKHIENILADFTIHHRSLDSFEAALASHCGVCKRILRKLLVHGRVFGNEDVTLKPNINPATFYMTWRMNFENSARTIIGFTSLVSAHKDGKPWNTKITLYLFRAEEQHEISTPRVTPPIRTDNELISGLVSSWINDCQNQHTKCHASRWGVAKPGFARIIDVSACESTMTVRVCEANEVPEKSPYLTLSHCWGGVDDIKVLSMDNYSQFLQSIPMKDLPQTFVDVIKLTKRLDYQYLWIDSLCIVQDSQEDWLDQSAKMDEIYRRSSCNIAASLASTPHGGIFSSRDTTLLTPLRVLIKGCASDGTDVWYDVDDDFSEEWTAQIIRAPIASRGWVLQERLLAPRVVHFGKSQLFWECVEHQTRESDAFAGIKYPNSRNSLMDFKTFDVFANSIIQPPEQGKLGINYIWAALKAMYEKEYRGFTRDQLRDEPLALQAAHQACFGQLAWERSHPLLLYWANIISTYNSLLLSREDDRLVAISGLARILYKRTGIRYVAGHWCYQMIRQLLWMSPVQTSRKQPTQSYVAPTWSWASCHYTLWHFKLDPVLEEKGAMDLAQVQEVHVKGMRGEDQPMGKIQSASLRIRGRLLPVELDLSKWPQPSEREKAWIEYWNPTVPDPPTNVTFLVPLLFIKPHKELPKATPNALLLEATETKGTYRRIGTARLNSSFPLAWTIPNLYAEESVTYHDSEDKDVVSDDDLGSMNKSAPITGTTDHGKLASEILAPRDQLQAKLMKHYQGQGLSDSLQKLSTQIRHANPPPQRLAALEKVTSRYTGVKNTLRGPPSKPPPFTFTEKMRRQTEEVARELTGLNVSVGTKSEPRTTVKIAPKDAVEERFYLKYVEDKESVLYGHFVFDII